MRMISCGGCWAILLALVVVEKALAFSFITDKRGAMIVTRTDIQNLGQGEVLGKLYPDVIFSHDELKTTSGVLILDVAGNRVGSSMPTILQETDHSFDEAIFLNTLRKMIGEDKLPLSYVFYDKPGVATRFSETAEGFFSWFVLDKQRKTVAQLPQGSIQQELEVEIDKGQKKDKPSAKPFQPVMSSVLVEMGEASTIKKRYETYLASQGKDIFATHFTSLPLFMEVYESRPGYTESDEPQVGGIEAFDLRYHNRDLSGQVVIGGAGGNAKTIPVCRVTPLGKGVVVVINAEEFVRTAVHDYLDSPDRVGELKCVAPDQGKEHLTACHEAPSDPCGPYVIEGYFGPENDRYEVPSELKSRLTLYQQQAKKGNVSLVLELKDGSDPTTQFRTTISLKGK